MNDDEIDLMGDHSQDQILARVDDTRFVDREALLAALDPPFNTSRGLHHLLLGPRHVGKTEILLRLFDNTFKKGGIIVPVYFAVRGTIFDPARVASEFVSLLKRQVIAFRSRNPRLVSGHNWSLDAIGQPGEFADLSWIRAVDELRARDFDDIVSAAEIVAAHTGLRPLVMLDNFNKLEGWSAGRGSSGVQTGRRFNEVLAGMISRMGAGSPVSFVLSGLERSLVAMIPADEDLLEGLRLTRIERLADREVEEVIRRQASYLGVYVSDSTAELMVQQLSGDLFYIRTILDAAAAGPVRLKTFVDFEKLYTAELLTGRIAQYFGGLLRSIAPEFRQQRAAIEALRMLIEASGPVSFEAVIERIRRYSEDAEALLSDLDRAELLDLEYGFVRAGSDQVAADYISSLYRREVAGARPAVAGEELLHEKLKTSYHLMMARFNRAMAAQLVGLVSAFDFQNVPASLFDQESFEKSHQASSRVQIRHSLDGEEQRIRLPQIVLVKEAGAGGDQGISWRLFTGTGFEGGIYSEANEVQWLIALINSKEPVERDILRRIDYLYKTASVAPHAGSRSPEVRWYVSKEGFAPSAFDAKGTGTSYFSNYLQLDLLREYIAKPTAPEAETPSSSEFELVIPIEEEAELIAARTVEQIARSADFDQQAVNQIKTALIEACINAAEHSDSPDRRIYQRFAIKPDRLVITVKNKGKSFDFSTIGRGPTAAVVTGSAKGSRGRGLQIIRALMDEVQFERTDDGSSLVMTKLFKRPDDH